MKLQKISTQVSPFSGINFLNEEYNKSGFTQLIDNQLGIRCKPYGFSYSDIIKNLMNVFFCGGDCAEDIQTHLRNTLLSIPDNNVPSADTILRGKKSFLPKTQHMNLIITKSMNSILIGISMT